jgi:hypothetical protein
MPHLITRCVLVALTAGGANAAAGQGTAGASAADPASRNANEVTIIGCLQRDRGNALVGVKSPSGFVLMNASSSPYGGSAGTSGAERSAPGNTGAADGSRPRSGDPPPSPAGGAGVSPGLTYLLEGGDLAAHAGERVEVRGTLHPAVDKVPLVPKTARAGAPANPQRLRVVSVRSIAKDCSR